MSRMLLHAFCALAGLLVVLPGELHAQDKKGGGKGGKALSAGPEVVKKAQTPDYEGPSAAVLAAMRSQSKEALLKVADFLDQHRKKLEKMSDKERLEFFDAELAKISPRAVKRARRGSSFEVTEKYNKLSDAGKQKARDLFEANRDNVMLMKPADRSAFMDKLLEQVVKDEPVKEK